ncbi:MAG: hypothetical protein KKB50_16145 [Planctomycetes bacterium]|nr:hypothetical protein [Planctomycetota bacterium]
MKPRTTCRWLRSGKTSAGLLVVLVLVLIIAGGYWGYKALNRPHTKLERDTSTAVYKFYCSSCNETFEVSHDEWTQMKQEADGSFVCKKCGQATARFMRPGSDALVPGGG